MKKAVQTIAAAIAVTIALASCSTTKSTGNSYQKHLSHKHTGAHHLSNGNGGCNWHRN